jgi:ribosomal subunit interface protein
VDIVVRGRNVEVPDHYRQHVSEKLDRVERYDQKVIRVDVELHHERNPRQASACQRVQITCKSRGPVVRAEACAADFYSALDQAIEKLESRLRRAHDRRRVHHGSRTPVSVAVATGSVGTAGATGEILSTANGASAATATLEADEDVDTYADQFAEHLPGRVVREKEHSAKPVTLDQALLEMELVGHDFYLFQDADSGRPSVVYRRKGYDYGVIRLAP